MNITDEQRELLDSAKLLLEADQAIGAVWLGGSLGNGVGDRFSDVDLLALVASGAADEVGRRFRLLAETKFSPLLVKTLRAGEIINIIASDWRRLDVAFVGLERLENYNACRYVEIFNKGFWRLGDGMASELKRSSSVTNGLVTEFIRIVGLLPVTLGRREFIVAQSGVQMLRKLLIDIMLEKNEIDSSNRGGALHLNNLLTPVQQQQVMSLSCPIASSEAILRSVTEISSVFLPLARDVAAEHDELWPCRFEVETRKYLMNVFGQDILSDGQR